MFGSVFNPFQGPRSNFEIGGGTISDSILGGGGGGTRNFFLLILSNFKNNEGARAPRPPTPLLRGPCLSLISNMHVSLTHMIVDHIICHMNFETIKNNKFYLKLCSQCW